MVLLNLSNLLIFCEENFQKWLGVRIPATSYLVPSFTLIYIVLFHLLPPYYLDVPCYLNNRQRYCSVWSEREGLFTCWQNDTGMSEGIPFKQVNKQYILDVNTELVGLHSFCTLKPLLKSKVHEIVLFSCWSHDL